MSLKSSISIAVRIRPLNNDELNDALITWKYNNTSIILEEKDNKNSNDNIKENEYKFTYICPPNENTIALYKSFVKAGIDKCCEGYDSCVFAYGQTSSGKTHTMFGNDSSPGLLMLSVSDIFHRMKLKKDQDFLLSVSYIEIYNDSINDLLDVERTDLNIVDDPLIGYSKVNGLSETIIKSPNDFVGLLLQGEENRKVAMTELNEHSSRSHTIFKLLLKSKIKGSKDWENSSYLHLVDLAGSESLTSTAGSTRQVECRHINKSLLALGRVIMSLSEGNTEHIPYRESKLTRVLQLALGGNSFTYIVCTVCPSLKFKDETLNTLRFGSFAKKVQVTVRQNIPQDDQAQLRRLMGTITDLKSKIKELDKDAKEAHVKEKEIQRLQSSNKIMELKLKSETQNKSKLEVQLRDMQIQLENNSSTPNNRLSLSLNSETEFNFNNVPQFSHSLHIPSTLSGTSSGNVTPQPILQRNYSNNSSVNVSPYRKNSIVSLFDTNVPTIAASLYIPLNYLDRNISNSISTKPIANNINPLLVRNNSSRQPLTASSLMLNKMRGNRSNINDNAIEKPQMPTISSIFIYGDNLAPPTLPSSSLLWNKRRSTNESNPSPTSGKQTPSFITSNKSEIAPFCDTISSDQINSTRSSINYSELLDRNTEDDLLSKLKRAEDSIILLAKKLADSGHELDPEFLSTLPSQARTLSIFSPTNNINSSDPPSAVIRSNSLFTPVAVDAILQRKNSVNMFDHNPTKASKIFGHDCEVPEVSITPSVLGQTDLNYQTIDSARSQDESVVEKLVNQPAIVFDASISGFGIIPPQNYGLGISKLNAVKKVSVDAELEIAARLSTIVAVSTGLIGWTKYNYSKPGSAFVKIWINLTPNTNELNFNWKAEGLFSNHQNSVSGNSIQLITLGRFSKVFKMNDLIDLKIRTQTRVEERSVSIVLKDRTIDLMAPNENDRKLLIDVLHWSLPDVEIIR